MGSRDDEEVLPALVNGPMIPMTLSEGNGKTSGITSTRSCRMAEA